MASLSIREFRDAAGLTLEDLAFEVGISVSQLSRIERDERDARASELSRLADRFKTSVGALFGEPAPTLVPLLSWVSAGRLADSGSQIPVQKVPLLAFADLGAGEFFALKVQGDSMDRVSPEGSVIVVNRADQQLVTGKPYVFAIRGESTYKRWRHNPPRLEPFSTNPANETIFLDPDREDCAVVGRVRRTLLDL